MPVKVEINRQLLAAQCLNEYGRIVINGHNVNVYRHDRTEKFRERWFHPYRKKIEFHSLIASSVITVHQNGQSSFDKLLVYGREHLLPLVAIAERISDLYQNDVVVSLESETPQIGKCMDRNFWEPPT